MIDNKSGVGVNKKKKAFFRRPLGITIIVILVILIGGGITAFALRDQILRSVLGPVQYYVYKEGFDIYDASTNDFALEGDISIRGNSSSLASWGGSNSSKIGLDIQYAPEKNKSRIGINVMGFLNFDLTQDDKYINISINDMDLATANTEKTKKSESSNSTKKKKSNKGIINFEGIDMLEWAYDFSKSCIAKSFPEKNIIEEAKDFNGTECRVTTFVIDSKVKRDFLYNMADMVESDKTTQKIFKQIYENIVGSIYDIYGKKADKFNPDITAKEFRLMATGIDSDGEKDKYSVYYDGGKIVNREWNTKDQSVSVATYKVNNTDKLSFDISDACSGEFTVGENADVSKINLKDKKKEAVSVEELMEKLGDLSFGKLLGFDSVISD